MSNAIGKYRFIFAQSPDGPLYSDKPIYGARIGQTAIGEQFQVLVTVIGDVHQWINVDPDDVTLFSKERTA